MGAVIGEEALHLRVFHDIVADEGRQRLDAEKFVRLVEVQVNRVHARAVEEIAGADKGLNRCVPGEREHMTLAVQQAPTAGHRFRAVCPGRGRKRGQCIL